VPGGKGRCFRLRGIDISTVSPLSGSIDTSTIESVRRFHRPAPASPPSSSTFSLSAPAKGASVVLVVVEDVEVVDEVVLAATVVGGAVVVVVDVVVAGTVPGWAVTGLLAPNTSSTMRSVVQM